MNQRFSNEKLILVNVYKQIEPLNADNESILNTSLSFLFCLIFVCNSWVFKDEPNKFSILISIFFLYSSLLSCLYLILPQLPYLPETLFNRVKTTYITFCLLIWEGTPSICQSDTFWPLIRCLQQIKFTINPKKSLKLSSRK